MLKVGSFSISRFLEDVAMELFEGTTEGKEPRETSYHIFRRMGETFAISKEGSVIRVHFSCLRAEDVEIIVN